MRLLYTGVSPGNQLWLCAALPKQLCQVLSPWLKAGTSIWEDTTSSTRQFALNQRCDSAFDKLGKLATDRSVAHQRFSVKSIFGKISQTEKKKTARLLSCMAHRHCSVKSIFGKISQTEKKMPSRPWQAHVCILWIQSLLNHRKGPPSRDAVNFENTEGGGPSFT